MKLWVMTCVMVLMTAFSARLCAQEDKSNQEDMEKLERAVEYFQSGKYHESRLLFEALAKHHTLNPRFRAYMGLCAYYDWDYDVARTYLEEVIDLLDALDPHERSLYYFACAESLFFLEEYDEAIPVYERHLLVCYHAERADAWYRIGFCHMFKERWQLAAEAFQSALAYYRTFLNDEKHQARIKQIEKMEKGCALEASGK